MNWLICLVVLLGLVESIRGYFVTVDAHSEECFFDRAEAGTKMGELVVETMEHRRTCIIVFS